MKKTTERLRKLEHEYKELKQILDLGLVPQKEKDKFQKELIQIESKIREEQDRLESVKENGEDSELLSKRVQGAKPIYDASLPEVDEQQEEEASETSFDQSETYTMIDQSIFDIEQGGETSAGEADEHDQDHWADTARWKRVADFERDAFEE